MTATTAQADPFDFVYDPDTTALVMIDFQRDFVEPKGFGELLGNDVELVRTAIEPAARGARGSGNFFAKTAALWIWAAVLCALVTVVTYVLVRLVRFPVLAAPFILTFWVFWPVADNLGLTKLQFPPFIDEHVFFVRAGLSALGATLFAGIVASGVLFFVGVLISNWRHAVLALAAAFLAHAVALWWQVPGEQINSGLAGFNAVLAAVAIYAFCGSDVRLALLGAIFASAILPLFTELGLISLAAGFVTTTWLVMLLGWFQDRWFNEPTSEPLVT